MAMMFLLSYGMHTQPLRAHLNVVVEVPTTVPTHGQPKLRWPDREMRIF